MERRVSRNVSVVFGIAALLLLWLWSVPVSAASTFTSGDYACEVVDEEDKTAAITAYTGDASILAVPTTLKGYTVIGIGANSLNAADLPNYAKVTKVILPPTLKFIISQSFRYFTSITEIEIPEGVEWIGGCSFANCDNLEKIVLPSSVTAIYNGAGNSLPLAYGSSKAKYYVPAGSYAEYFLKNNQSGNPVISSGTAVPVTGVSLSTNTITAKDTETDAIIEAIISPSNASNRHMTWTSSNTKVADINENSSLFSEGKSCILTINGAGTTTITGTTMDGKYSASCQVTVEKTATEPTVTPTPEVTVTPTPITTPKPTVTPAPVKVGKTKIYSVTNMKTRKAKVKFKKLTGITRYQIQYSTSRKFTKSTTKSIYTTKTTYTKGSLKKNKTYYFRVRGYKTNSAGKKVYGSWSYVKTVKIRK